MEIDLSEVEIAPVGSWTGTIVTVTEGEEKSRKGVLVKTVNLDIALDVNKSDGNPFRLAKVFKMNTKGRQKLHATLKTWHGGASLTKEVLVKVDPKAEFETKRCRAHVDRVSENGKQIAKVGEVLPE